MNVHIRLLMAAFEFGWVGGGVVYKIIFMSNLTYVMLG